MVVLPMPGRPSSAVADGRDAVQRALNAGPVVIAETGDTGGDVVDIGLGYVLGVQDNLLVGETGFRWPAKVKDNLQKFGEVLLLV
jgi:hypothetical protein